MARNVSRLACPPPSFCLRHSRQLTGVTYRCSDHHFKAVVFVNEDDELSVVDRNGRIESLQTSSFSAQLDICLVFLDEAHTRGIDLKLPKHYRAAVTLGASLTKDRLVQGMG